MVVSPTDGTDLDNTSLDAEEEQTASDDPEQRASDEDNTDKQQQSASREDDSDEQQQSALKDDDSDDDSDNVRLFHGYRCTDDCSGQEAGYRWAEDHGIDDPDDCGGNSQSFIEGCRAYAEENCIDWLYGPKKSF